MNKVAARSKKVLIGIVGGLIILVGLIMVPYPGPGWLVVFAGLAVLSTEFEFAQRMLAFARGKYDAWAAWLKRQHWAVKLVVLAFTGLVVLLTMWLLNAFGLVAGLLGIDYAWLTSPLFR